MLSLWIAAHSSGDASPSLHGFGPRWPLLFLKIASSLVGTPSFLWSHVNLLDR